MLSARVTTLGAILLVACVGLIVAGGVSFWTQRARLVDDVDDRLIEKVQALRPVGDAPSPGIYLTRTVTGFLPSQTEGVVGVVDGEIVVSPSAGNLFRAIEDPAVVAAATKAVTGNDIVLGTVSTDHGEVRSVLGALDGSVLPVPNS